MGSYFPKVLIIVLFFICSSYGTFPLLKFAFLGVRAWMPSKCMIYKNYFIKLHNKCLYIFMFIHFYTFYTVYGNRWIVQEWMLTWFGIILHSILFISSFQATTWTRFPRLLLRKNLKNLYCCLSPTKRGDSIPST